MAKTLFSSEKSRITRAIDERIASLMASALADPDVDEQAKSLAGYLLQKTTSSPEPTPSAEKSSGVGGQEESPPRDMYSIPDEEPK